MNFVYLPDGTALNTNHIIRVMELEKLCQYMKGEALNIARGKLDDGFRTAVYMVGQDDPLLLKDTVKEFVNFITDNNSAN